MEEPRRPGNGSRVEAWKRVLLDYEDVEAWETKHGRIAAGSIVLLRTGWGARWPDAKRYLGDDTPGDASRLHFPAYGADAARLHRRQTIFNVQGFVGAAMVFHADILGVPLSRRIGEEEA